MKRRKKVATISSTDEVAYIWVRYLRDPVQLYLAPVENTPKQALDMLAEAIEEDWGEDLEKHAGFGEEGVMSLSQLLKGKALQEALRQLEYSDIAIIDTPTPANRLGVSVGDRPKRRKRWSNTNPHTTLHPLYTRRSNDIHRLLRRIEILLEEHSEEINRHDLGASSMNELGEVEVRLEAIVRFLEG